MRITGIPRNTSYINKTVPHTPHPHYLSQIMFALCAEQATALPESSTNGGQSYKYGIHVPGRS